MDKIKAFWSKLPHIVQAGIVLFAGAAASVVFNAIGQDKSCLSFECWKHYLADGFRAGVGAVVALYLPNSRSKQ